MRKSSRSLVIALAVVALSALPAAAQMDATDEPRVSGPLRRVVRNCRERAQGFNDRVVARSQSCVRFYAFRTADERDGKRDYGVVWLQTELRTKRNWCATSARSDIKIPPGTRVHARTPRVARASSSRRYVARLRADADGNARRVGRVRRPLTLCPRVFRGRLLSSTRTFRAKWRGNTGRTVAFASGVEISWGRGDPPERLATAFSFRLERAARC